MTQYREVKRQAAVGERIRIVDAVATFSVYANGDEFDGALPYLVREVDVREYGAEWESEVERLTPEEARAALIAQAEAAFAAEEARRA